MEPTKLSRLGRKLFNVIEFDENEKLVHEIKKHPFGLFVIYVAGLVIAIILFAVCLTAAWFIGSEFSELEAEVNRNRSLFVLVGLVLALLSLGATFIAGHIYSSNSMLITNEKIAQVLYKSLFSRKISQLSIGDVQDVTVTQDGIFPRMFNYGTIVIETAGEQQNYTFTYAPDPYQSAKAIVGAHEKNLQEFGN